jgi:hypothetical protein
MIRRDMTAHHSAGRRTRDTLRRSRRRQPVAKVTQDHEVEAGESRPPTEPIIFLTPWQRFGLRRLYATDEFGADGGYLDLRSGEFSGTRRVSEGIFRQVLPELETRAGGIGISAEEWAVVEDFLDTEPKSDRYEAEPLVVGCRMQSRWMDRLFVRRIEPGAEKVDLGWIDLTDGKLHADVPGAEPVIRHCAEKYQEAAPKP